MNKASDYEVGCDEDDAIERRDTKCAGLSRRLVGLRMLGSRCTP